MMLEYDVCYAQRFSFLYIVESLVSSHTSVANMKVEFATLEVMPKESPKTAGLVV